MNNNSVGFYLEIKYSTEKQMREKKQIFFHEKFQIICLFISPEAFSPEAL